MNESTGNSYVNLHGYVYGVYFSDFVRERGLKMGMTIKGIIDGLQFTIDMFLFNPSTGEIQPKHLLNEDSRLTVDACEGAIDIMRKYQKITEIVEAWKADVDIDSYDCITDIYEVIENGNDDNKV